MRRATVPLFVLVVAGSVSACGGGPSAAASGTATTAPIAAAPTTTAPRSTTLPTSDTPTTAPTTPSPSIGGAPTTPAAVRCDEPLQVGTDGSVAPLGCPDGQINIAALSYYEGGNRGGWYPTMLELPTSATRTQVVAAMCHDIGPGQPWPSGIQTEQQAYDLAAQLHGWRYELNVLQDVSACR